MKVKVLLKRGEDGWIVATVPSMPGCISQGKTRIAALANIREAIGLWQEAVTLNSAGGGSIAIIRARASWPARIEKDPVTGRYVGEVVGLSVFAEADSKKELLVALKSSIEFHLAGLRRQGARLVSV